jgi:hypothetical protein
MPRHDAWETDGLETDQLEYEEEMGTPGNGEMESPFDEVEEIQSATELLSVANEAELDQFIGKLLKGAVRGIRKAGSAVGPIAMPLGGRRTGVSHPHPRRWHGGRHSAGISRERGQQVTAYDLWGYNATTSPPPGFPTSSSTIRVSSIPSPVAYGPRGSWHGHDRWRSNPGHR